jgi:hypothetical protein
MDFNRRRSDRHLSLRFTRIAGLRGGAAQSVECQCCDYAAIWKELALENKTCTFCASGNVAHRIRTPPEGQIAMAQAILRLVDGAFMDRSKALKPFYRRWRAPLEMTRT